jgi:ABC-type phosphate/phosphonate transport system permease subunit
MNDRNSFFLRNAFGFPPDLTLKLSAGLFVVLVASSWSYLLMGKGVDLFAILSKNNLSSAMTLLGNLLGQGTSNPAYGNPVFLYRAIELSVKTLKMSLMGIGFAGIGMLLTVLLGARRTADGSLTLSNSILGNLTFYLIRWSYVLARGIPELFWAMFLLFLFTPGILPGAIALAIHNYGILGKLCSEIIEDLDPRPIRSLRSSGAGLGQILIYGVLPAVTPQFLTYGLYRWEEIIRTTIVVGFVSAGGLGRQFKLSMGWFHYTEVTVYLACYFVLVITVDLISGGLRALAKLD